MTIQSIDVNVCSPGRNFVTLKIVTGDGVVGWGDATLNGRELSVAAYLSEHLASTLIGQGLVDEYRLFVAPVVLGGGTPYFPPLETAINLELVETRTFDSPAVYLRYRRV